MNAILNSFLSILRGAKRFRRPIFIAMDAGVIVASILIAFLLRFDGTIPSERWDALWTFAVISLCVTIPVFWWQSMYKISWSYVALTDIPKIARSVVMSVSLVGLILFLFKNSPVLEEFPRSVIFSYGLLLFLYVGTLRFSKRIYWQLFQGKLGVPVPQAEFPFPFRKIVQNEKDRIKTVLLTGGAGYLGSMLTHLLLSSGYRVRVVDRLLFGDASLQDVRKNPNFELIERNIFDLRDDHAVFADIDCVVHLAAIVGEPACVANKDLSLRTNYLGTVYLARLCKAFGIKRFIFASTCSVYGEAENGSVVDERSSLKPVDFYGETKIYAERELLKLMDEHFTCVFLRFGTLYGLSYRMRFDLVVNTFAKKAVKDREILLFGGKQWRPLVHVQDAARAIYLCVDASTQRVANQIFNVGGDQENYLISDVSDLIKEYFPETCIKTISNVTDQRSYRVSFQKIKKVLGFEPTKTVGDGIAEIKGAIDRGVFQDLENKQYYNHLFQK
ncbi:MAG: NAD-dependent epimerase/dehydratase family protein [Candidatus Wildermuthbacteria bacterium]|nr:NAD-dependent epimerase/dehydratase family protein [Candidatus Wildermuthbacteria bacterium]